MNGDIFQSRELQGVKRTESKHYILRYKLLGNGVGQQEHKQYSRSGLGKQQ